MRKKILTLTISVILFFAVVIFGVATLFVVDDVSLYFLDNSSVGLNYRDRVQKEIEEICLGKNILFLKEDSVMKVFDDDAYVRATSVRKVYPNKIVVYAEEVREIFAVRGVNGYFMFDKDGVLLSESKENVNRADGHTNIVLEGFAFDGTTFTDEKAFAAVKEIYAVLNDLFDGARTNVSSISWIKPTSSGKDDYFEIGTQEGVLMRMSDPFTDTKKKIEGMVSMYKTLDTQELLYGVIDAFHSKTDGSLKITYTSRYGDVKSF